jgi:hypothetical protein
MATRRYISRLNLSEFSVHAEVSIYDPNRWHDGAPKGGPKFGFGASIFGSRGRDGKLVAGVQIGGIGSHSPEDAAERIDVYAQGADVARFITDMLAAGVAGEVVEAYLFQQLGGGKPTTARFVYAAGDKSARLEVLNLIGDVLQRVE